MQINLAPYLHLKIKDGSVLYRTVQNPLDTQCSTYRYYPHPTPPQEIKTPQQQQQQELCHKHQVMFFVFSPLLRISRTVSIAHND